MKTIGLNTENMEIINKSKFFTFLIKIQTEEEAKGLINNFKTVYKDATHVCSAYICDSAKKANDDGEPSGTAGMPILNILEKNELDHVLCIIVRYFGGVKLGASGLIRAYSNCTKNTLAKTDIIELQNGYLLTIKFDYTLENKINRCLLDVPIEKKFEDKITYKFKISEKGFETLPTNIEILEKKPTLL